MDKNFKDIHIINTKTNEVIYVIRENIGAISIVDNYILVENRTIVITDLKNIKIVID